MLIRVRKVGNIKPICLNMVPKRMQLKGLVESMVWIRTDKTRSVATVDGGS